MNSANIHRQNPDEPLYPDVLWNKPENKHGSGKLLIIGGNKHRFFIPAQAQGIAEQAGVGYVKVLMPDGVKKLIGSGEHKEFGPSNPSGSFSRNSLETLTSLAKWSDGVLLAGDAGHNSETATMIEAFLGMHDGMVTITHDFLDMYVNNAETLFRREHTLVVASFSQLQKLAKDSEYDKPFTYGMNMHECLEQMSDITTKYPAFLITKHQDKLIVAVNGSVAHMKSEKEIWRVEQASKSSVFWLQQPETPFESITTSLLDISILKPE